ncbi:MAG: short-chain dehydrogenase [Chloroflexi bacterium HGW-Chloroflexi-4]|jgi:pteridine reductase|nr:MAG: short-chain dehydrogenase [Chloroflexi bacterium HGW-Chloroflexi-4]
MSEDRHILVNQTILITGGARRLGKVMGLAAAQSGADVIVHHAHSPVDAENVATQIRNLGRKAWVLEADLNNLEQTQKLMQMAFTLAPVSALINNAAIFKPVDLANTTIEDWTEHLQINLTAPFLLSQVFAAKYHGEKAARIINMLDWRALRPGRDHFPYTISKSALAAMTSSMALALAPRIIVNGIALGAILPPGDEDFSPALIKNVPMQRWSRLEELEELIVWLLSAPEYITGEIIHLDGGRHLV